MPTRFLRVPRLFCLSSALGLLLLSVVVGRACTAFVAGEPGAAPLLAKSYEYPTGLGFLFLNQRDQPKLSPVPPPETPAEWRSRYGSVTFNVHGKELPSGGMNERGLVVEVTTFVGTVYPEADARPAVLDASWVQYQLDNCATVQQVLDTDAVIRITRSSMAHLHFVVADASGDRALIEWVDGRRVVHRGTKACPSVQANDSLAESLALVEREPLGTATLDMAKAPGQRFEWVSRHLSSASAPKSVQDCFALLKSLNYEGNPSRTQWALVYDPARREMHFRTRENAVPRVLCLQSLRFAYEGTQRFLAVDSSQSAIDATWEAYTPERIRPTLRQVFDSTGMQEAMPDELLEFLGTLTDHRKETALRAL